MIPAAFKNKVADVQKNPQKIKKPTFHDLGCWDPQSPRKAVDLKLPSENLGFYFSSTFPTSLKCFWLTVANQETNGEWGSRKYNSQLCSLYFPIYFHVKHLSPHTNDPGILLWGSIVSIMKVATSWHQPHLFGLPPSQGGVTEGGVVTWDQVCHLSALIG